MTLLFQPDDKTFSVQAERVSKTEEGLIVHGAHVHVNLRVTPHKYYRHGWQSWSLTTWQDPNIRFPALKPSILNPMQTDPLYVNHPAPNGSWLGAVDLDEGKVLMLGALGLEAHVALHGQQLHGWYETGGGDWFIAYGKEAAVFARYAGMLGERLGNAPGKPTPRVWCSWYSLYNIIRQDFLYGIFDGLADLPFDVLQVDDGWQVTIGDWEANEGFPAGMEALSAKIRASGRAPGLWLAPLLAVPSSSIYRQHSDWLLHDLDGTLVSAGFNWGEPLYALDTTHPEAMDWLRVLMKRVRAWGFDYLKLDFLYAGALPGARYTDMPREAAYRQGLQAMREAMGADAYFLACGAPILPSLGLCDALRLGPDVAGFWENQRDAVFLYNPTTPGTRNAIRTTVNRLWLKPLVATDPDVTYFAQQNHSLSEEQSRLLQDLALVCNYKATSDLPQMLTPEERQKLREFLLAHPMIERTGRNAFKLDGREVDFSPVMPLPDIPSGWNSLFGLLLDWSASRGWTLKLLYQLGMRALQKKFKNLLW